MEQEQWSQNFSATTFIQLKSIHFTCNKDILKKITFIWISVCTYSVRTAQSWFDSTLLQPLLLLLQLTFSHICY
jgi:hypothetical protein